MRLVYPLLWSRLDREACREQSIRTVAALARRGIEATLLMPQRPQDPALSVADLRAWFDETGDFRLVQRPSRWVGPGLATSLMWLRQVSGDLEIRGADLVYSRIPAMLGVGRMLPIPFATDHYRPWPDEWPLARPLIRRSARHRRCAGVILHSHYAAAAYRRAGIPEDRILVAHNGGVTGPAIPKAEARGALGLPLNRPIAVYAGRLREDKGLDALFALAALRPAVLFLLVGSEGDGAIERTAADRTNVTVAPWAEPSTLARWLHAADVLIVPPSRAPLARFGNCVLPMKLFSYLAAGRPILAPASPDTAELLRDGENALLVAPDRPEVAAAALDRLLNEPGLADRLGGAGRRLSSEFTWDRRAERISAFLAARLSTIRDDQRSLYSRTVKPSSAAISGAPQAPTDGGKAPTWPSTVRTPSPTR